MKNILKLLIFVVSVNYANGLKKEFAQKALSGFKNYIVSKDKKSFVTLFKDNSKKDENRKYFYFYVCSNSKCSWVNTPKDLFVEVKLLEFIDNNKLLFSGSTELWRASYILDIKNNKVYFLGGGIGKYIEDGKNKNLIYLSGAKGYAIDNKGEPLGAYWADKIVDIKGRLVEVISKGDSCFPLKFLIDKSADLSKLRQKLDTKVCVEQ